MNTQNDDLPPLGITACDVRVERIFSGKTESIIHTGARSSASKVFLGECYKTGDDDVNKF